MFKKQINWLKEKWKAFWKWILVVAGVGVLTANVVPLTRNEVSIEKLQQKYEQSIEVKAKYQLDGNSLKATPQDNPKDMIRVVVGNKDDTEFTPSLEISRWDEVSFKLIPNLEGVATKDKNLILEGDRIKFETPRVDYELYGYEDGYKYVWYLKNKPDSNVVEFEIESEGLDFFYQPELTQEEKDRGDIRPENVVGSYAIYHSTKGGINDINGMGYRAGKFGHIYRPRLIDSNGWEVWGNLHIENGIYSIELPDDFYNNAVYPIKSNDTFGNANTGGSGASIENTIGCFGNSASPGESGTITSITADIFEIIANQHTVKAGIYQKSDSTFVGGTTERSDIDDGQYEFTMSPSQSITNQDYYLCVWANGSGSNIYVTYDGGGTGNGFRSITYGSWPNPAGLSASSLDRHVYATYTPAGAAAPKSIQTPIRFE